MPTNKRKIITNKQEQELKELIDFKGKYVDSLIKSATGNQRNIYFHGTFIFLKGDTVSEILKNYRDSLKEAKKRVVSSSKFRSFKAFETAKDKAYEILRYYHTGHSKGCYRTLYLDGKMFEQNNDLEYYSGYKYKPTHGEFTIELTFSEFNKLKRFENEWYVVENGKKVKKLVGEGYKNRYSVSLIDC